MALEDRCSPQSAPSPPGIPHSPQSTTSSLILDMSLQHHQQHHHQQFYNQFTNPTSTYENQFKFNINQQTTTDISQFNQKMSLGVRNFINDRLSPQSDDVRTIKEEEDYEDVENDSIIDDNDDNNQDNEIKQSSRTLSFSITNILSDKVGKKSPAIIKLPSTIPNVPDDKKPIGQIFRPFEITSPSHLQHESPINHNLLKERSSAFTRLSASPTVSSPVDILDYSRTTTQHHHQQQQQYHQMNQQAAAAAAAAVMMAERANFLNCFNPAAYPRIHEEILNSTRKYQKHHQKHTSVGGSGVGYIIPNEHNKMPPLGSLCKTVSQIGQPTQTPPPQSPSSSVMCSPPPGSSISSISSSSSASPLCRLPNNSPQPIPPPSVQSISRDSGMESSDDTRSENDGSTKDENGQLWPAWVYCTRYSDRPSSGPRYRRPKQPKDPKTVTPEDKRPRTAFSSDQLARLKREFNENRYLTERRRLALSAELGLNEAQIKIWFQNKRAKLKKTSGSKNPLALQLMAQGLYNHTTVPLTEEEEELEMRMNGQLL